MNTILKIRKIGNSVQVVVVNKGIMLSATEAKKKKWSDFKRKKEKVDLIATSLMKQSGHGEISFLRASPIVNQLTFSCIFF